MLKPAILLGKPSGLGRSISMKILAFIVMTTPVIMDFRITHASIWIN